MRRIILDCDPGHDDAMAIILAHGSPEIELAAITTVAGNHRLELTTLDALRVCELAGIAGVPVAAGCAAPLLRPLVTAEEVHGEKGLEGHDWPAETRLQPVATHGVDLIIDLVMESPGEITLVPTGPLTNLAVAMRKEPRIVERTREVVMMGGAHSRGNVTPAAEFNTYVDPEAAEMVFRGAWPVTMIGLEVTHMALATPAVFARLDAVGTPVARAVTGMLGFYRDQLLREEGRDSPPVHDPCAVARVIDPSLVSCRDARVDVELGSELTRGMTVTDFRSPSPTTTVGIGLDAGRFWDLFVAAVAAIGARG